MKARAFLMLALALIACGDDDVANDASVVDALGLADIYSGSDSGARDSGARDSGARDAASDTSADVDSSIDSGVIDVGVDAAMDAATDTSMDAGFGMSCEGACAATRLEARFGAATELFDVAYFGFNGDGTLYVEAYGGAADGCPEMGSPSPDRTLIIGALPVPTDSNEVTVTASLLDFEGTLTSAPFVSTPMARVRAASALLTPLETAFVRIDFNASFDGGDVDGALYATHCTSLDT